MALRWGIAAAHAKWSVVCQVCSNVTHAPPWDWPFHMWALPGWSNNERRETESSGGEMKSPLAQTDRRRDQRCASANIFLSILHSVPSLVLITHLPSILFTGSPVASGLQPTPAWHQSPSEQMWGFRADILTQELITDWPRLFYTCDWEELFTFSP